MPRKNRIISPTRIYHVIMRGVNKQKIFLDDKDRIQFLQMLKEYKEEYGFRIYAYCLMTNHIHILICEGQEPISETMRRLNCRFAMWYNKKYLRTGYLFQDRFKSEPIDSEAYLLTVSRYIHQNPLHARMVRALGDYEWSSYNAYLNENDSLVDKEMIRTYFPQISDFIRYMETDVKDNCMEYYTSNRMSDEDARELAKVLTDLNYPEDYIRLDDNSLGAMILILKDNGINNRQISEITGTSKDKIRQFLKTK